MKDNYKYIFEDGEIFRVKVLDLRSKAKDHKPFDQFNFIYDNDESNDICIFDIYTHQYINGEHGIAFRNELLTKRVAKKKLLEYLKQQLGQQEDAVWSMKESIEGTKEQIKKLEKEIKV